MRLIAAISIFLMLAACSKPDPNPELKDPIYSDLQSQLGATTQALDAEEKKLEGYRKELEAVLPQTGQIKFAQKRVYESEALATRLKQEVSYLKLKIEQRRKEAIISYRKAFEKKESWPNPAEYASYQVEQKMRAAKRTWDVKNRMKEVGINSGEGEKGKSEGAGGEKEEKKEH